MFSHKTKKNGDDICLATAPFRYVMSSLPVTDAGNRVPQLCPTINIQTRPVPPGLSSIEAIMRGQDRRVQPLSYIGECGDKSGTAGFDVIDRMLEVSPAYIVPGVSNFRNQVKPMASVVGFRSC